MLRPVYAKTLLLDAYLMKEEVSKINMEAQRLRNEANKKEDPEARKKAKMITYDLGNDQYTHQVLMMHPMI